MGLSAFCKLGTALSILALLAACGGGGGSNGGSGSSSGTTTTTIASTTTTTIPGTPPTLSGGASIAGVAATGSPLLGASIKVVDATGAPVSLVDGTGATIASGTTSWTDGSYRVTLGASAATLPLLIEAVGRDAAGMPVVLHSLLASNAIPVVANITPATDAVVAMVTGSNPLTVFQNAASHTGSIALLGSTAAVSAASDQVKAIIAANLTDAKVTSSKTLDFFQDTTFSPNKTGLDAALEGLRIQVVKDANGNDQLQLSNKFLTAGTIEVKVDLATAKTELATTSGGSVAKAIVSTAKATTSATTTMANLGTLDNLGIAADQLIAQGKGAVFSGLISPSYSNNAYGSTSLTTTLGGYANSNYQLNKFQMTGCADDPISSKGCTRVLVSTIITNAAGQIVDTLSDAVAYSKTTTPNWTFVGNNLQSDVHIYPVAYITYGLDGSVANTSALSSGSGVQVSIFSPATNPVTDPQRSNDRMVQMPNGHIVRFTQCGLDYQCLATDPASPPAGTGELKDFLLQQATFGWMGTVDTTTGAKYHLTVVNPNSNTTSPVNAYLPTDVPSDLSNAPFPRLDNVSATTPLITGAIVSGPTLSWANWAAANPGMKIFLARTIIASASATPLIQDATIPPTVITSAQVPPAVAPAGFVPQSFQVWLGAQDNQGRRYYSKYTSAP